MRLRHYGLLYLCLFLAFAGRASLGYAQGATTGSIRGNIHTPEGGPVASAQISVTNSQTGMSRGVIADAQGRYSVLLLPPGVYTLRVESVGYAPAELQGVQVRINEATSLDVKMTLQAVALEGITVTADRALQVDTRQAGVAEYVSQQEIEKLPALGRDFTDFIALSGLVSPQDGVSTGGTFAIGGGRTSGVNVQIDGADANFNFFGESRGGARIPFTFSLESIKEFQVITNGFDVEFGNYSSGVVNVVTRGGTNKFRGSALSYFRSDALTRSNFARPGAELVRPDQYQVQQYAVNVSGPIIRDRLHFLFSFDGQRRRDPFETATPEGTGIAADSIQRFVDILENTYGLKGARNEFGRFKKTDDVGVYFGRLDWTINNAHRASLRANYADYSSENDGIQFGSYNARTSGAVFADRNLSVVGELNSVLGQNTFNVFRLQFADEHRPRTSNNFLPMAQVTVQAGKNRLGYGGSGTTFRNDLRETKVQLINNLTHSSGAHTLKVGTNNTIARIFNQFWASGNGAYTFNSLADFEARRPAQYTRSVPESGARPPETTFNVYELSLYAQDEWQVTDRLLATFGLRNDLAKYTNDFARVERVDTLLGLPAGFRTGNSPADYNNISPRLSLAYDLTGSQGHVLRAGVGYYYGRVPGVLGSNVGVGTDPIMSVRCTGNDVPAPDYGRWASEGADGSLNPTACISGAAPTGLRQYSFWGSDFEYPETLKGNLGYEGRLAENTRVGIDLIYGRTNKNFTAADYALSDEPVFRLASEGGRPVYVPEAQYTPKTSHGAAVRSRYDGIDRIYVNTSDGVADEFAATVRLDQRLGAATVRASYTYNWAKDNSSVTCCTSSAMFSSDRVAETPNLRSGRSGPEWAMSDYVRPHTVVVSGSYSLPLAVEVSGIFRAEAGTPYTVQMAGDIGGTGASYRPFIFDPKDILFFGTPAEQQASRETYARLLDENACVGDYVGQIVPRNTCRNPARYQLDMSLRKALALGGEREIELVADFFNVLNGLNRNWGQLKRTGQTTLLYPENYDAAQGKVAYRVNDRFGQESFIGPVRQFQTQLGVRVRF